MKKNLLCKLKLIRKEEGKLLAEDGNEVGKMIIGEYFSPKLNKYLCSVEIYQGKELLDSFFETEFKYGAVGIMNPKRSPTFSERHQEKIKVQFPTFGNGIY